MPMHGDRGQTCTRFETPGGNQKPFEPLPCGRFVAMDTITIHIFHETVGQLTTQVSYGRYRASAPSFPLFGHILP